MKEKKLIAKSIFMTHVRRIGLLRTALGGGLMYISILEFMFLHVTTIVLLYKGLLAPALKLKNFKLNQFIILDRGRINRMRLFDKLNCVFCGYANGVAHLWNTQLDELAAADLSQIHPLRLLLAIPLSLVLVVFLLVTFILSKILFLMIATFLGMHWAKTSEIRAQMKEENYAGGYPALFRGIIRFTKLYARSLALNLEQIESSWCPLTHLKREEASYPEHHKNFYPEDKLDEVIEVLGTEGTVSERKPRY